MNYDHQETVKVKQVQQFIGRELRIQLKCGTMMSGTLVFYHFESQVIHLQNWEVLLRPDDVDIRAMSGMDNGKFLIINKDDWSYLYKE